MSEAKAREEEEEERIRRSYNSRSWDAYSWSSTSYQFMMQDRERHILRMLAANRKMPLKNFSILEVGCGTGAWLRDFIKWGADPARIHGIDLLEERISIARRLCPVETTIKCGSGTEIEYKDASFDIVLQATVFTSILDAEIRVAVANEMRRVVKPDGLILWYDFHVNNPRNKDVRRVDSRELGTLFPDCEIDSRKVTLAPPLARAVAPRSWMLAEVLGALPALRTHTLAAIRQR